MSRALKSRTFKTVAELVEHLGGIPAARIWLEPKPGTAREHDALALAEAADKRLCELIDGILVEKTVGARESMLAAYLIRILGNFVAARKLGLMFGSDFLVRLFRGQVRIPDLAFVSWDNLPDRRVPETAMPKLAPDLVVEVLSKGNTKAEMERKRRDYFRAGGKLFWEVDAKKRLVRVFTSPEEATALAEKDTLDGGMVLPGFTLRLRDLFAELDQQG